MSENNRDIYGRLGKTADGFLDLDFHINEELTAWIFHVDVLPRKWWASKFGPGRWSGTYGSTGTNKQGGGWLWPLAPI